MPSPPLFPKYMLFFFGKAIYSEIWVCLNHAYTLKIDGHQFLCFQFIFQMLQNPVMFPVNRRILISTRMNGTNNSLSVINRVELLLLKGQHLSNTTPSHIVAAFFPKSTPGHTEGPTIWSLACPVFGSCPKLFLDL